MVKYYIEIEKADGAISWWNGGKEFEDKDDAEERAEFLWNMNAHTGNYARFAVLGTDGEIYSELEC